MTIFLVWYTGVCGDQHLVTAFFDSEEAAKFIVNHSDKRSLSLSEIEVE